MGFDIKELLLKHKGQAFELHETALNTQMVKLLRTIGYARNYVRAEGPYLYDDQENRYLDCLSGFGVFGIGRNHPKIIQALRDVLDLNLSNMVQMDCPLLAGILAKKLVEKCSAPLDKVFFCNSGTEAVEAAIKFSRAATKRQKILYCEHAFHGLTYGSLSLNGDSTFRDGFGPFLGECFSIPFNDLEALEIALKKKEVAAFIVEPIQGKGVHIPKADYLREAKKLCEKQGTLLVLDEVQTGLGRTGKFFAFEHFGVEPDMITLAKVLSGGFVPVGAVITKKSVFEKVFNRLDRAVVHGSTYAKNNLAMAAGLSTLSVIEEENLVEKSAEKGRQLREGLEALIPKYEFLKEVRGHGMMLGLEFGPPKSFSLKTAWALLEKANKGLFCQMIALPLFKEHRILSQVAGHGSYVIKLLPAYDLSEMDITWIVKSFDAVIDSAHHFPGAMWDLATSLASQALSAKKLAAS